jgi:hypothetical protein
MLHHFPHIFLSKMFKKACCFKFAAKTRLQYKAVMQLTINVAEPHHFYGAPAPDENFDAAPAPSPTLLYSKAKFF